MNMAGGILRIGDPTFIGWLTVAAYMLAALLCAAFALRIDSIFSPQQRGRHRLLWWSFAVSLLLLGINKQLDVQTALTRFGRGLAYTQGWYDTRRIVQVWFIAGVALLGLVLLIMLGWSVRRVLRQYWLTLCGFIFLVSFIVIRATSFHYVDKILSLQLAGFRLNWILELGGITCIALSAGFNLHRAKQVARSIELSTAISAVIYRQSAAGQLEVLLIQNQHGDWTLPRGRVEPDADKPGAVARAMLQATGIRAETEQVLRQVIHTAHRAGQIRHKAVTYYLVRALPELQPSSDADQPLDVCWFPIKAALRQLRQSSLRDIVFEAQDILESTIRDEQRGGSAMLAQAPGTRGPK